MDSFNKENFLRENWMKKPHQTSYNSWLKMKINLIFININFFNN